jgi:hypothetical protein
MTDDATEPREIEPATDAPATESAAPAIAAPDEVRTTAPVDEPPLAELLAQYDAGVQSRQQPAIAQQQPVDQLYPWQREQQVADLAGREQQLAQHVQQLRQGEYTKAETAAFVKFAAEGQAELAGLNVPENYIEDALIAASIKQPLLRQYWAARNDQRLPAQTRHQIAGALRAVRNQIVEQARRRPDPELTADYNAVAAAVRSAGGRGEHHHEPPPNYGSMGEGEFRRHVLDKHGFDPMR